MVTTSIVKVNQRFSDLLTLAEGGQSTSFDKVEFTVACLMSRAKFNLSDIVLMFVRISTVEKSTLTSILDLC